MPAARGLPRPPGRARGGAPSTATRCLARRWTAGRRGCPRAAWRVAPPRASGSTLSEPRRHPKARSNPTPSLTRTPIPSPDLALPLTCAHLAQSRAGDRDLAARLAVHLAAGGQGGPGLAHGEPRRPGPPGLLGAYSCCSPYSLLRAAECEYVAHVVRDGVLTETQSEPRDRVVRDYARRVQARTAQACVACGPHKRDAV